MKTNLDLCIFLALTTILIRADNSLRTNCLFRHESKLFMLLDLKNDDPYYVRTSSNDWVYFNFCDAFTLPLCNFDEGYLGYLVTAQQYQCFPLTSHHSGKFQVQYGYVESIQQNVLDLSYHKDFVDKHNYQLRLKIICSQEQFQIRYAEKIGNQVEVYIRSIHGCPVYQMPALLQLVQQYQILISIFCFLVGFLFLFYGRVMIHLTAFFSIAIILIYYLTFLCFYFMEENVQIFYLYLTIIIILISSFTISYFIVKSFVKASLFFIGAQLGFFAGTLLKAFVLTMVANLTRILILVNGFMNFVTIALMLLIGSLTLEHKQYVIIYSTTLSGSYLIIRGISILIGGFPCQFELFDLIQSKQLSSIPLSFYIYLLFILLLAAIGGIYQELKLAKQQNLSQTHTSRSSGISSRVSSYIEGNLDLIHDQIEKIINRYRTSQIVNIQDEQAKGHQHNQQMQSYKRLKEPQGQAN